MFHVMELTDESCDFDKRQTCFVVRISIGGS